MTTQSVPSRILYLREEQPLLLTQRILFTFAKMQTSIHCTFSGLVFYSPVQLTFDKFLSCISYIA